MLGDVAPPRVGPVGAVQGCGLVRVLAVAEGHRLAGGLDAQGVGQAVLGLRPPAPRPRRPRRRTRRPRRCRRPRWWRRPWRPGDDGWRGDGAVGLHLGQDRCVVGGVDHHGHVGVVLGPGPDHGRPTDVDQVDRSRRPAVGEVGGVGAERVQVADQQVDALDAVGLHVGPVPGVVAIGQQPAVDLGVQRHDPVAEDGRGAGELGHVGDRDPGLGDGRCRPPAGDQVPAGVGQAPGQIDHTGLVVGGEEGTHG